MEPVIEIFGLPTTTTPTVANLFADFLPNLPELIALANFTNGKQELYEVPESSLFLNNRTLTGFIVGLGLLQLIFIFALLGLILEQCGVIEKLYRRSKTGYDSDSESFVTATDEKTQTESRSPRSLRGRRRKRDSLTSSVMSPSFSERKTNESSGMKYWFSAQNPNESARQMSSRRAATHRKLSPGIGSDGGSIFNFF